MKSQATRNDPHRDEQVEILGCILFLMLYLSIMVALYSFPWHLFR